MTHTLDCMAVFSGNSKDCNCKKVSDTSLGTIMKTMFPTSPESNASAGVKYDQDKPDMSLLSSIAITELTAVLDFGKRKYAAHNWRKGISTTRLLGAALRHIFAYLRGETNDPETGLSHIAHAMCCCMFILELKVTHPQLDDRFVVEVPAVPQSEVVKSET